MSQILAYLARNAAGESVTWAASDPICPQHVGVPVPLTGIGGFPELVPFKDTSGYLMDGGFYWIAVRGSGTPNLARWRENRRVFDIVGTVLATQVGEVTHIVAVVEPRPVDLRRAAIDTIEVAVTQVFDSFSDVRRKALNDAIALLRGAL